MPERKKKLILGSLFCVLIGLLGLYYVKQHFVRRPDPVPVSLQTVGVIDLKQAMKKHPRYADLEKLRRERALLAAESAAPTRFSFAGQDPVLDNKVFQDAANQKIGLQRKQLEEEYGQRLRLREQQLRDSLATQRQADKKAIEDSYLNAMFNCRLKLDNAQSLRLSEQQQEELRVLIDKLQLERGDNIRAIDQQYERKIASSLDDLRTQYRQEMQAGLTATMQAAKADAAAGQTKAQQRNADSLQQGMQSMEAVFAARAKAQAAVTAKDREVSALEDLIIRDLASKSAKFALLHQLDYVFADPFVNVNAMDITAEVMEELQLNKN